jgi:hypothetical protein
MAAPRSSARQAAGSGLCLARCAATQFDLLYDVIRIQRDTQLSILADVQSLCVRTARPTRPDGLARAPPDAPAT